MEDLKISDRIAFYRMESGMSKKQLAEACGVSPTMITKYENSTATPSMDMIARISAVLGITMNRLVFGYDEGEVEG